MVVEVFVAQRDGGDPLGEHGLLVMDGEDRVSRVRDGGVEGLEEAGLSGDLAEQQGPGIGGEPAAQKSRRRRPCCRGWKTEAVGGYSLS